MWGTNYELEAIEAGCEACALGNVVVSEFANHPPAVRGQLDKEAEQMALIARELKMFEHKAHVAGFAIWCFNDYATMRKERYNRQCGLVDAWRVPKMSAAFLRAKYTGEPFITVFANWGETGGGETGARDAHIFTNCDEVAIVQNGRPVATIGGAPYRLQPLPFEPGSLVFVGRKDGREARYELVSFREASRVALRLEKAEGDAEQRDTIGVVVRIADDEGRLVTTWNGKARMAVEGAGLARGYRGDNAVDIAGGVGRFFVTGNGQTGGATVTAWCETLAPAVARIGFH